jgi:2-polyprenyl-6-methoxyphenol hydroxylase-like FAD-dependent oxidoreductase
MDWQWDRPSRASGARSVGSGMSTETLRARVCVVGGGPCGLMLSFLLARAGVDVVVLEKHADFLRDFRGDTIHPSTLELMNELGLYDEFLQLPHVKAHSIGAFFGDKAYAFADFSHLRTRPRFIALMPQWDFLNFLAEKAKRFKSYRLLTRTEATDLIEENGAVVGVRAKGPDGDVDIRADLVVGCDGRASVVRARAGLAVEDIGAPMDVLWFRLSKRHGDPGETMGRFNAGQIFILIDRGDYWQCACLIAKGGFDETKRAGIERFRTIMARNVPFLADRVDELTEWDQIKLLTVAVNRLTRWYRPGLLCIGDAAHAMSPVGGIGVNLAVQDAVATANILAGTIATGPVSEADLAKVQARREFPTKMTQRLQVMIQKQIIGHALTTDKPLQAPLPLRLMARFPFLRRIPARVVGIGVRPEHICTPDVRN